MAVPLFLVLLIVGISSLPPYTENPASAGPFPTTSASGSGSASPSPNATRPPDSIEAETGTLVKPAVTEACDTCSGGTKVHFIGKGGTDSMTVLAPSRSGDYTLTIYYTCSSDRSLNVKVNDGKVRRVTVASTGSWHTVGTLDITVTLHPGPNTIGFGVDQDSDGPDLDKITIQ